MAILILEANESKSVMDSMTVIGSTGADTLKIVGNPDVIVNGNVDRVDFGGNLASYKFVAQGSNTYVYSGTTLVATIDAQGDTNGTLLAFPNGSATLIQSGATTVTLGGQPVSIAASGTTVSSTVATTPAVTTLGTEISGVTTTTPTTPTVGFSTTTQSVAEGASGASTTVTFTVTLTGGTAGTGTISVPYTIAAGTATSGSDYTATNGTVSFTGTETSKTFTATITGDGTVEPNETFIATLGTPTGATLNTTASTHTVTITNDDANIAPTIVASPTSFGGQVGQTVSMGVDFTVADTDTGILTVTITPANGQVQLPALLDTTLGTGQAAAINYPSLTMTGTIANLNAALDTLKYQTGLTSSGTDVVTVSVSDGVATAVTTTVTANIGTALSALTTSNDSRTGSAGDDSLAGDPTTLNLGDTIDLGQGSGDTLTLNHNANTTIPTMTAAIKGVEKLVFSDASAASGFTATVSGDNFNGELSTVTYQNTETTASALAPGAFNFTNLKQGATVNLATTNTTIQETSIVFAGLTATIKNGDLAGSNSDSLNLNLVGAAVTGATNDNVFDITAVTTTNIETVNLSTGSTALDIAQGFRIASWTGTSTAVLTGANTLNIGKLVGLNTINGSALTSTAKLVVGASSQATAFSVALTGGSGADTLIGATLADNLTGNGGADVLYGGTGNDVFSAGDGDDTLIGNDTVAASSDTMTGGAGSDTYFVSQFGAAYDIVDAIVGFDFSSDKIAGLASNVTTFKTTQDLSAAASLSAATTAALGTGAGQINTGQAGTFIYGGSTYLLINTTDTVSGTPGLNTTDTLVALSSATNIPTGTGGVTTLALTNSGFSLTGSFGPDEIVGSLGADTIGDGAGADTITGGSGSDTITLTVDGVSDRVILSGAGTIASGDVNKDTITNFLVTSNADATEDVLQFGSTYLGIGFTSNSVASIADATSCAAGSDEKIIWFSGASAGSNYDTAAEMSAYIKADASATSVEFIIIAGSDNAQVWFYDGGLDGAAAISSNDLVLLGVLTGVNGNNVVAANFAAAIA